MTLKLPLTPILYCFVILTYYHNLIKSGNEKRFESNEEVPINAVLCTRINSVKSPDIYNLSEYSKFSFQNNSDILSSLFCFSKEFIDKKTFCFNKRDAYLFYGNISGYIRSIPIVFFRKVEKKHNPEETGLDLSESKLLSFVSIISKYNFRFLRDVSVNNCFLKTPENSDKSIAYRS